MISENLTFQNLKYKNYNFIKYWMGNSHLANKKGQEKAIDVVMCNGSSGGGAIIKCLNEYSIKNKTSQLRKLHER